MTTADDQSNATPFLMPLHRPPQVISRRIVSIRPAVPHYNRTTDLVRLLPLWPEEIADCSVAGRTKLVQMLERALRAERQRGVGGHWAYNLSRHASLMQALQAERAALQALVCPRIRPPSTSTGPIDAKHCRPTATIPAA